MKDGMIQIRNKTGPFSGVMRRYKPFGTASLGLFFICWSAIIAIPMPESFAGAFDQLQSMAGGGSVYVPPVNDPVCVSGCEASGSEGEGVRGNNSSGPNLFDRISQWQQQRALKRQQEEQQKRQEAFSLNEQGNRSFEKRDWDASISLYKQALSKSPADRVIQENLRRAEQEKRRIEELQKERSEFRKKMGSLVTLLPAVKSSSKIVAIQKSVVPFPGFTSEQWAEYLAAQETVSLLYARLHKDGKLSDADAASFYKALSRRNELWALTAGQPHNDEERDNLLIPLPRVVSKALLDSVLGMFQSDASSASSPAPKAAAPDRRLASESNSRVPPKDPITTAFASDFFADKMTDILESETGDAVEAAHGELMKNRYESMLAVGRIAVSTAKDGVPAAGAETADLIISMIPKPARAHAEFAVEGGRMYSKVAYQALNRFMADAMNATGTSFDAEAFWKNFNDDLAASQKGVKAWIQFGE
jgi:hypothetical protein